MNLDQFFITIRKMMVLNNTYVHCAGLRLIKYLCVSHENTELMLKYKLNIFIIMSLERSDKLHYEREIALSLVTHLVTVSLSLSSLSI